MAIGRPLLLSLCLLVALSAAACHGGVSEQAAPSSAPAPAAPAPVEPAPAEPQLQPAPAEPQPEPAEPAAEPVVVTGVQRFPRFGPLEAGTTYSSSAFLVPLTLTAPPGWQVQVETADRFELESLGEDHGLVFFDGDMVWGPGNRLGKADPVAGGGAFNPAPSSLVAWVRWFHEHPWLEAGSPRPVELGGREGVSFVTITKGGKVGLFGDTSSSSVYFSRHGTKTRWYVLNVDGAPAVVGAWASSPQVFDDSIDSLEAVLESTDFSTGFPPIPLGPLEAGTTYGTSSFLAPLTLIASEGWRAPYPEHNEEFELESVAGDHGLVFFVGDHVIAPDFIGTNEPSADWPEDSAPLTSIEFTSWFRTHPQLEAYEQSSLPTYVETAEGYRIETLTKGYTTSEKSCAPCVGLFTQFSEDGRVYLSEGGQKTRWYSLNVDWYTVVIGAWGASAEIFDASFAEMDAVLDSITFRQHYYFR